MRQMALMYPDDDVAGGLEDQFMFGPDLLAAPVLGAGETERKLYLPEGRWIDFWEGVGYVEKKGSYRTTGAKAMKGGREVTVPAPLDRLPLMIRAGSVLPMLPAEIDTLASYGDGEDLVRLDERENRLRLLAFPRGRSRANLGTGLQALSVERGARQRHERIGLAAESQPRRDGHADERARAEALSTVAQSW